MLLASTVPEYLVAPIGTLVCILVVLVPVFLTLYAFIARFATVAQLEKIEEHVEARHKENQDRADDIERKVMSAVEVTGVKVDNLNQTMQVFTNEISRVIGTHDEAIGTLKQKEAARVY